MAAVASPIPQPLSSNYFDYRRPTQRALSKPSTRTYARRSPLLSTASNNRTKRENGDSSDEDDLAPIKLSAEAQAILGEDNSQVASDKENFNAPRGYDGFRDQIERPPSGLRLPPTDSPSHNNGSPAPRVVRLFSDKRPTIPTTIGRDGSFMYKVHDKSSTSSRHINHDVGTPEFQKRVIRVSGHRRTSRSPPAMQPSTVPQHLQPSPEQDIIQRHGSPSSLEDKQMEEEVQIGPSTILRPRKTEENGIHSTMRVRRIGVGSLLSRPVRRGMIRRPSEEENMPESKREDEDGVNNMDSPEIEMGRRAKEPDLVDVPDLVTFDGSPQVPVRKVKPHQDQPQLQAQSPPRHVSAIRDNAPTPGMAPDQLPSLPNSKPTPVFIGSHPSSKSSESQRKPIFKIASLPPLSHDNDQENEPPPTFKKTKASAPILHVQGSTIPEDEKPTAPLTSKMSPNRQPLAARSNNTPHRPAPAPPPKMSLIEAATSNAGSRKKGSTHVVVNDRQYRRLDCIGRGGSSRVYRIMADNFKIFALKRVNLEDADMAAIAGYKGEIDLLKKLENVDRVIRLFDYEINEEKSILNVVMDLGESDFNKMLNEQLKGEDAKLDITFTRHYWKEMLECVAAVHAHDIVHSDLKPANFLLVKGQLKLIDFGIANAIQDNTVNVHRENQIGTPNYMSPESLVCQIGAGPNGTKDIKLGKPSDVWSLGCILYQMTYGQPPFAHITQQMQRIMAIPNPKVEIQFPARGLGGAVVPFGLIKTLRRCLTREQSLRPTVAELLSEADPFLCPVAISPDMLGRVIGNVMSYCRRREEGLRARGELVEGASCLPKDEEMRGWPQAFYDKLRQAQEDGTAW